jgi:hypothetical protein
MLDFFNFDSIRNTKFWMVLMATAIVITAGGPVPVMAQNEVPVMSHVLLPSSTEQGATDMDSTSLAGPELPPIFKVEEKGDLAPFFRDSSFSAQARSFYMDRRQYDGAHNEAWALGGSLSFKSGYLADYLRIGAVGYTSQRFYGPDQRDGTLLLKPRQEGYTILGQLYGEIKFTDRLFITLGRKEYNTPFINKNDSRMTPNTFQGYTFYGEAGGRTGSPSWRFGGGYIDKIKERNSDEFVWMSKDAGAKVDRGVYAAMFNFKQNNFSIGAFNYYSDDIINIFYTDTKYSLPLSEKYLLQLSAQYINQRSTGEGLLKGDEFSTGQGGIKADLSMGAALLTVAYTNTANGSSIENPWGTYPAYTNAQVQEFHQAGESALMLRAEYDFSNIGYDGLSAYALTVQGRGVEDSFNENETDLNLQWTPKHGALKGFSFRTRYAVVDQRGSDGDTLDDFRLIVNYDF